MKFTIAPADLIMLLKSAGIIRPRKADAFTLSACAARVFVEFKGDVSGVEELVLSEGAVILPAQKFLSVLGTYKNTRFLNIEGGPNGLKIQSFTMSVLAWNPRPEPPAQFHLFPVKDMGVVPAPKADETSTLSLR